MSISRNMLMAAAGSAGGGGIEEVFSTYLYTGNNSTQTIVNGTDLAGEGGLVWIKARSTAGSNHLGDTVRGGNKWIYSNLTQGQDTVPYIPSFNSDGFDLNTSNAVNASGTTYASWTFRKAPRFFDVVTYTGDGVAGRTIPHNLGVEPGCIIVKRTDSTGDWQVYHRSNTAAPETDYLVLNSTAATVDSNTRWNDTAPTDSAFTVGTEATVNASGGTYVAYLFAHDTAADGVIQCGSYTGNGSATGPTISLGWEPQWVLVKRTDSTGDWWMYDNARSPSNPRVNKLLANSSAAEDTAGEDVDFTATGFQPKATATGINASGGSYLYMAIRAEGT